MPDVLHASAAKYSPSWGIDYTDAGVTGIVANTTRYGAENIWRLHETYLFDIDRKQSDLVPLATHKTKTSIDGTYKSVELFNSMGTQVRLNDPIDLNRFPSGLYIFKVIGNEGEVNWFEISKL